MIWYFKSSYPELALLIKGIEKISENLLFTVQKKSLRKSIDHLTKELIQIKLDTLKNHIPNDLFYSDAEHHNLVHGDFHNENILFDESQNIVRLLDFEETHLGHRVEDVMHFIFLACCNSGFNDSNIKKARFFTQAYKNLYPLSDREFLFGLNFKLFKESSSFFIENMLYQTGHPVFVKLLERDLIKLTYFRDSKNKKCWIESILNH